MIVLLAVLDGNLLKYDTPQENLFKVNHNKQFIVSMHSV